MAWPTQQQSLNDSLFNTNRTALQVDRQITALQNNIDAFTTTITTS